MFSTLLRWALLAGAVLPFVYFLLAIYCAWRFFRKPCLAASGFTPPVSILKPVRGLDREAYENFASFCRQDYPEYEILFCVANADDPAIPTIQKLICDFPHLPIRLLMGFENLGVNSKVNKLGRLTQEARYDLLVISDSDIRVGPNYLRSVVSPFRDARVGAVTSLYVGLAERRLWPEMEAINLAADFFPGVLVAEHLEGVKFALGATMAIPRQRLAEIGGWESLANSAADDFELGRRIATRGYRVELVHGEVKTVCASDTARRFLTHHMRWAVVIRHSRPWGYLGLLLTQGLPWSIAAAAVAPSQALAAGYLVAYLLLRPAMAFTVGVWGLNDHLVRQRWWLLPFRDALGFSIWLASFFSNRVLWRGVEYSVQGGHLVLPPSRSRRGSKTAPPSS